MSSLSGQAQVYVATSFTFQIVLLVHFMLRRWAFDSYIHQFGWVVYALALPAAIVSFVLMRQGAEWWMWIGGYMYLVWAVFGYIVEYRLGITWRSPIVWSVFVPYIVLYLSTTMLYWWPLARVGRPYWLACTVIFAVATFFNATSH